MNLFFVLEEFLNIFKNSFAFSFIRKQKIKNMGIIWNFIWIFNVKFFYSFFFYILIMSSGIKVSTIHWTLCLFSDAVWRKYFIEFISVDILRLFLLIFYDNYSHTHPKNGYSIEFRIRKANCFCFKIHTIKWRFHLEHSNL